MNAYLFWFFITCITCIVIGVGYCIVKKIIQDIDAKRQLEGKIPERKYTKEHLPQEEEKLNPDFEIEKDRMRAQNLPHI